jgi:hypothetical protein
VARAKGERAEKIKRERKTRMKRKRERVGAVAKGGREPPSEGRKGNRIDK